MDFIEKLFGIAPDGGSGWLEVLILSVVLALFTLSRMRRRNVLRRGRRR